MVIMIGEKIAFPYVMDRDSIRLERVPDGGFDYKLFINDRHVATLLFDYEDSNEYLIADIISSAICGEGIYWLLDTKTMRVYPENE